MRDLISVIVPAYNVETELTRCIESILAQTYDNIEIILVDDGSTDDTGAVADKLEMENPAQIKVIHQRNKGLSGARNSGLDIAKGEYISFIDSDDYVDPEMLEYMLSCIYSTNSEIAICGRVDEYPSKRITRFNFDETVVMSPNETMGRILTWDKLDIAACDKLYLRKLWDDIRFPEGYNNEDLCTIPLIVHRSTKIVHVGKTFYHYCHRENSITTSFNLKKIKDFMHAIHKVNSYIEDYYPMLSNEIIYYNNHSYLNILIMCDEIKYVGSECDEAKDYLKQHWNNPYSKSKMTKKDSILKAAIDLHLYKSLRRIKARLKRVNKAGGKQ